MTDDEPVGPLLDPEPVSIPGAEIRTDTANEMLRCVRFIIQSPGVVRQGNVLAVLELTLPFRSVRTRLGHHSC